MPYKKLSLPVYTKSVAQNWTAFITTSVASTHSVLQSSLLHLFTKFSTVYEFISCQLVGMGKIHVQYHTSSIQKRSTFISTCMHHSRFFFIFVFFWYAGYYVHCTALWKVNSEAPMQNSELAENRYRASNGQQIILLAGQRSILLDASYIAL